MATLKLRKSAALSPERPPVRRAATARRTKPAPAIEAPPPVRRETAEREARPTQPPPDERRTTGTPSRPSKPSLAKRSSNAAPRRDRTSTIPSKPPDTAVHPEHPPGSVRLSKRMSELGITSRREADEWIARGWVRVDGEVVAELGSRVLPHQEITIDRRAEREQTERVTILLHKPVGYVSGQAEGGYQPAITLITPDNHWSDDRSKLRFKREHLKGLAPAGRLDIDSVGLLVLTQDGRVARQLIGERSAIEKEYLVRVQYTQGGRLPDKALALLNHGLELDGVALQPAKVSWQNEDQLRFVLREGKKRQIRRMCAAVGLKVLGLKRVRIGRVALGKLPPGQWRYLHHGEKF